MRVAHALAAAAALGACAAPPAGGERGVPAGFGARGAPEVARLAVALERQGQRDPGDLDPDVLLPVRPAQDRVIARVGDLELRESQVFARCREIDRRAANRVVQMMIVDAVVAANARRFEVRVTADEVDELIDAELDKLRRQVELERGGAAIVDDWVRSQFEMSVAEYRDFLRLELARERYRDYVIRYLELLEDRVEVRVLAHRDRAVCEEVAAKVREGADFAALARRQSEDESSRDGGLLPPFGRGFQHPVAARAFELEPGALSEIVEFEENGARRYGLVYCLRRMPGRDMTFAEAREELRTDLLRRPVTRFEYSAFVRQYCSQVEALNTGGDTR